MAIFFSVNNILRENDEKKKKSWNILGMDYIKMVWYSKKNVWKKWIRNFSR